MNNSPDTKHDDFIAPPCHEQINILHEDDSLLVIDKPSGLLSLSGKNPKNNDSVHSRLIQDYPTATMVHRLDFGTSGIMVVALNTDANAHLTKQFQARTVIKTYHATLFGHVENDEGIIDAPIAKAEFPHQKICHETGKSAQSHYHVLERLNDPKTGIKTTKVRFTPHTGRTHQLRVHSQSIGHPIIGCDLYGLINEGAKKVKGVKGIGSVDSQHLAERLMLHASRIVFDHPDTHQTLTFESLNIEKEICHRRP